MTLNRPKQYLIIRVAVIAGIFASITFLSSGDDSAARGEQSTPQKTLESFYAAMKTGDFDTAMTLCDMESMNGYISTYRQEWMEMSMKDSAQFAAIASIIAGTTLSVDKIHEEDGVCTLDYTLSMDGTTKRCKATTKKEEGEWKVAAITNEI